MNEELVQQRSELLRAIRHDRAQLNAAVDTLKEAMHTRKHIGELVTTHPYHWLSAGAVLGLLLGSRSR